MKYEYIRIDKIRLLLMNIEFDCNILEGMSDVEVRHDHNCYFLRKGSKTHTWLGLKYPQIFESIKQ